MTHDQSIKTTAFFSTISINYKGTDQHNGKQISLKWQKKNSKISWNKLLKMSTIYVDKTIKFYRHKRLESFKKHDHVLGYKNITL